MADVNATKTLLLLVEDNPGDRDLLLEYLEETGVPFQVQSAGSLAGAGELLAHHDFRVAFLDLGLPDSMGLDTVIRFKTMAPALPIIVLTGLDDEETGIAAIRAGAQDYLVKSQVTSSLLVRAVRHATERHALTVRIDHFNRVLRAIRNVNQLIVRETDPEKLISQACQMLIETRGYNGAWIALGDCKRQATAWTYAGFENGFLPVADLLAKGEWPPCIGQMRESDERLTILDPEKQCDCPLTRTVGHNRGGVCILEHENRIFGALSVSFPAAFDIDADEIALLNEIAGDIAFALHGLDVKKQREQARDQLLHQHRFLEDLIDAIPVSVFYKDIHGIYSGCNKTYAEFLGKSKQDIIGHGVHDMFPADLAGKYHEMDEKLFADPGVQRYEAKMPRADNTLRHVLFNKATYTDDQGNTSGIIGAMLDITDRIEMEQRLQQSQKMEAIGTLAGGIAHDFNNILSAIIGFTELSFDKIPPESDIEDYLQEIHKAGNRARDLVRQILAFARRSDAEIKPIQPIMIIKEVIKFIRSSIPATIEINTRLESKAFVMGNATQIHQVIMNLCTNAAHAMEERGGRLGISLKETEHALLPSVHRMNLKPADYLELTVSDTGVGIPAEIMASIFEPYFTTKNPGEGTGLGLAMVQGIVTSYGGIIAADSTPGEGSVFTIYLPISRKNRSDALYTPGKPPSGTERILFVDDEPPLVKIGTQMLTRLGYTVTGLNDAEAVLARFRAAPQDVDLVITDMTMPKMTGLELAARLMAIRPDIPVILFTGYSKQLSPDVLSETGIRAIAYKPIVKSEMAETVRRVLDERGK